MGGGVGKRTTSDYNFICECFLRNIFILANTHTHNAFWHTWPAPKNGFQFARVRFLWLGSENRDPRAEQSVVHPGQTHICQLQWSVEMGSSSSPAIEIVARDNFLLYFFFYLFLLLLFYCRLLCEAFLRPGGGRLAGFVLGHFVGGVVTQIKPLVYLDPSDLTPSFEGC